MDSIVQVIGISDWDLHLFQIIWHNYLGWRRKWVSVFFISLSKSVWKSQLYTSSRMAIKWTCTVGSGKQKQSYDNWARVCTLCKTIAHIIVIHWPKTRECNSTRKLRNFQRDHCVHADCTCLICRSRFAKSNRRINSGIMLELIAAVRPNCVIRNEWVITECSKWIQILCGGEVASHFWPARNECVSQLIIAEIAFSTVSHISHLMRNYGDRFHSVLSCPSHRRIQTEFGIGMPERWISVRLIQLNISRQSETSSNNKSYLTQ